MARMPKVLVTHHQVQPVALDILRKRCDVILPSSDFPTRSEILALCPSVDGLLWTNYKMKLDTEILDACGDQLRVVSLTMNGVDCVDCAELARRNIALGHTPNIPNGSVANIAVGLMIACNRPLTGATIGFVGFGGIGEMIAKRLQGFDIGQMLYCGHQVKSAAQRYGAQFVPQDELLMRSDFLFLCCPLTKETHHFMNRKSFSLMKATAVLINVARGGIVDEDALINALKSGQIFAAGLDTVSTEPLPAESELLKLHNCVVIPHLGTATKATRDAMAILAAENLLAGLRGDTMPAAYKFTLDSL